MSLQALRQFYLVGGTSLALQIGHRFSIDLDLFTTELFNKTELLELLNTQFEAVTLESEGTSMLITNINHVKNGLNYPSGKNPRSKICVIREPSNS